LGDERIESGDELAMPICFVDPSAFFGVCGQVLGVEALGGEDCEVGGVGVKAGAVLADVGVRA
jgi:hypothetical protein